MGVYPTGVTNQVLESAHHKQEFVMKCPFCNNEESKVVDKRTSGESKTSRRRRECLKCGKRFTTYERIEESSIKNVIKRDGKVVPFKQDKITNAIWKAFEAVGEGSHKRAKDISDQAVDILEDKFSDITHPTVEQIQDIVEKMLVENTEYTAAKAYILYRKQHEKIRSAKRLSLDVQNTVGSYLERKDWRVKENANESFSFSGLLLYTAGKVMANYNLNEMYSPQIAEAHTKGYFHIHDLSHGVIGYCSGWSLKNLLMRGFGGVPNKVDSRPAKHIDVAVQHMMNYIGCLQMEFSGAQAFNSVDTLLAPFVKKEKLEHKKVKQAMQELVYSLNVPARWGCFSEDTEILAEGGWKFGKTLKEGEKIATFNKKTEEIEYLSVLKMTKYHHKGKMYRLKNNETDQLLTPNHRVLIRTGKPEYVFKEASNLETGVILPLDVNKHTTIEAIEQIDYDGLVWCPTTENNTVVVRRRGKVFISGNSQFPFSNLAFDWKIPDDMKNQPAIVGGKEQDFAYGDCQEEADMVNKAFLEIMLEGDAHGRVFTFPIPTYNLTKDFDWGSENAKLLFGATSKYGLPYFQNYIGSDMDPKSIRAMCCRLQLNQKELLKRPGGMWGPGDNTGSIGVVTINLNRLGYEAKDKEEFFSLLFRYMKLAKESLEVKRVVVEKNLKNGLMPYAKAYLGTFRNHFSTIGLVGMNEACLNLIGNNIATEEGKKFAIETLEFMKKKCLEFQNETGNLYNLEATPAEGASYRLAMSDKREHPNIITAGKDYPYLTNSTFLPVGYTDDLAFALKHQNDIQPLYTGGTIFHTFLGESLGGPKESESLVKKIAQKTKLPYFNLTPTFSVCPKHTYIRGKVWKCPTCKTPTEVFSRVVGYLRPVKQWNDGKQEEFKERQVYSRQKAAKAAL